MDNIQVDLMFGDQAMGPVANSVLDNHGRLNAGSMRPFLDTRTGKAFVTMYRGGNPKDAKAWVTREINTNATLRRDEWKALDEAILDPRRSRLGGVQDLVSKGLVYNLGNAMGTTVFEWHDVSEALSAEITMDGVTRAKNDRLKYQHNYIPIPIIHADYEVNARELAASRRMGNPIDTTLAERAARRVDEKLETMLFTDVTFSFGEKDDRQNNKIYSYLNHPDRNLVNLSIPWDNSGVTAAGIIQDIADMKQSLNNAYFYGPFTIYIPSGYERVLDEDYSVSGQSLMSVRERILKLNNISEIKVIDTLPANNVLMVQMTSDVVRLINGMGLTNVEWDVEGKFITKYKVLTIRVPQIRSDQDGRCGIAHLA